MTYLRWLVTAGLLLCASGAAVAVDEDYDAGWDGAAYDEQYAAKYMPSLDVELAFSRVYDAVFSLNEQGYITNEVADVLYGVLTDATVALWEVEEEWYWGGGGPPLMDNLNQGGMGGPGIGDVGGMGETFYSQIVPSRQLYLSTNQAMAGGETAPGEKSVELLIDDQGVVYLGTTDNEAYDTQLLTLEEGWQQEFDSLLGEIDLMVEKFMEEHSKPVEEGETGL